jgi:predicted alpha/beta superfamily hydrolase
MKREVIHSKPLHRDVTLDIVLPEQPIEDPSRCRLLLVNDGQDAEEILLAETLRDFQNRENGVQILAVAIHAGDRKQEYGVAGHADYAKRGSKAANYAAFLTTELIPWIREKYGIEAHTSNTALIGFSMGALSAFDIAWNHSSLFGAAGLFSGSFWWRSKALEDGYTPADRIAHHMVETTKDKPPLNLWFQTGWMDESADRDDDGLIDSIGDTVDLLLALKKKGFQIGKDMEYRELGNGRHDHKTMGRILPNFLSWWQNHHSTYVLV